MQISSMASTSNTSSSSDKANPFLVGQPPSLSINPNLVFQRKYSVHYKVDGNVVLRAEDTFFKVHLSILHQYSSVLRKEIPADSNGNPSSCGMSQDRPFHLWNIKVADVESLLWILYPENHAVYKATTLEEWQSICELATKWKMDGIRNLAAEKMDSFAMTPAAKIALWQKLNLNPAHLASSYLQLCQQMEPLSTMILDIVGPDVFVKLTHARERMHRQLWPTEQAFKDAIAHPQSQDRCRKIVDSVLINGVKPSPA